LADFVPSDFVPELLESVISRGFESLSVGLLQGEGIVEGIMLQVNVCMLYVFSR